MDYIDAFQEVLEWIDHADEGSVLPGEALSEIRNIALRFLETQGEMA